MISAFLLLAGKSTRFGGDIPKQYIKVKDKYIFEYPLNTFDQIENIDQIYLVCDDKHFVFLTDFLKKKKFIHPISIILGGSTRQESVFNGLKTLQNVARNDDIVLFHDACRPLIRKHEILNLIDSLKTYEGATIATPLVDSICKEDEGFIDKSIKREKIYKLQTPQGFKFGIIYAAHLKAQMSNQFTYTDDTSMLSSQGVKIKLIGGSIFNFKITTKDDLTLFEKLLEGFNFD